MGLRWTEDDFKRYAEQHKIRKVRISVPPAYMEPDSSNEPVAKKGSKGLDSRCCIDVVSYRHRLADADGISAKALIDGLIHSQILPNDSPEYVQEVRFSQVKIPKTEMEFTEVIVRPVT